MTEAEWLACAEIERLLSYLRGANGERMGRKARLLACACARQAWSRMHREGQGAIEVAERYADGLATAGELAQFRKAGMEAWSQASQAWPVMIFNGLGVSLEEGASAALYAIKHTPEAAVPPGTAGRKGAKVAERRRIRAVFTDIFGNPFRPITLDTACLMPQIIAIAQAACEHRDLPSGQLDPSRLAVLADALEDAGCDDADLLAHLRGPGPHVRGCWALDLILGKS